MPFQNNLKSHVNDQRYIFLYPIETPKTRLNLGFQACFELLLPVIKKIYVKVRNHHL